MNENVPQQLVLDLDLVPESEIKKFHAQYEVAKVDKMAVGAQRYGAEAFLGIDQIDMAMDELVDFGNYCAMMYVKLGIMRDFLIKNNIPLGTVFTAVQK